MPLPGIEWTLGRDGPVGQVNPGYPAVLLGLFLIKLSYPRLLLLQTDSETYGKGASAMSCSMVKCLFEDKSGVDLLACGIRMISVRPLAL